MTKHSGNTKKNKNQSLQVLEVIRGSRSGIILNTSTHHYAQWSLLSSSCCHSNTCLTEVCVTCMFTKKTTLKSCNTPDVRMHSLRLNNRLNMIHLMCTTKTEQRSTCCSWGLTLLITEHFQLWETTIHLWPALFLFDTTLPLQYVLCFLSVYHISAESQL